MNRLVVKDISEIVVEDLDFRGGGLGRQLNRIMTRAGRAAVSRKLKALREEAGIVTVEVNPAFTSRECSRCHYVDKRNRSSQAVFRCVFCGFSCHADVNAARSVRGRRSFPEGLRYVRRDEVLRVLDQRFMSLWGVSAEQFREQSGRPCSRARCSTLVLSS